LYSDMYLSLLYCIKAVVCRLYEMLYPCICNVVISCWKSGAYDYVICRSGTDMCFVPGSGWKHLDLEQYRISGLTTSHNNSDFTCTPIALPATSAPYYEIKHALLNLVMKDQFSRAGEDAALHLNNFIELCDMQKYKEVDGDIVKLKIFSFSLRGRTKEWLQSLRKNSIDSWSKCKDAFIGKYYPPAKIIQLRSNIMNFRQLDNEHVAQAWERMKTLVKNCPTYGLTTWMVNPDFLCRVELYLAESVRLVRGRNLYVDHT